MDKRKNVIVKVRLEDDLTNSHPISDNDDLLKSQTVSDNSLHTMEETPKKDLGGNPNMTFIDEGNLYQVIFQSRKPNAVKFKEWIFYEVIPSIRKHGAYITEDLIKDDKKLNESIQATLRQVISLTKVCNYLSLANLAKIDKRVAFKLISVIDILDRNRIFILYHDEKQ